MKHISRISVFEREILFRNTAEKCGMSPGIVEKDFWVCWTLGYEKDEPWAERSKTRQDKFNKEANARTEEFLRETFLPQLQADFEKMLNEDFFPGIEEDDPQTVCFGYPKSFQEGSILPVVRLEIGALAAWTPAKQVEIASYAAQQYPKVFNHPTTSILAVAPERPFWEKVTILHKEVFRTNGRFPARYSRHYYDLWCMDKSPVKAAAYGNLELLERVVRFKERFYPAGSAHYELAKPGTMRLLPPEGCIPQYVYPLLPVRPPSVRTRSFTFQIVRRPGILHAPAISKHPQGSGRIRRPKLLILSFARLKEKRSF